MSKEILITGGAGFIGVHLANELIANGYRVRILDTLLPQVHADGVRPPHLSPQVNLIQGDIADSHTVHAACRGVDAVCHLAARVGVGQSMYEIDEYTSTNDRGTAVLLEALINQPVERLVVASSMSVYGEGMYQAGDGSLVEGKERTLWQLAVGKWEVLGPGGEVLRPVATPEVKTPSLASVYALSKFSQEQMCHIVGRAYNIPTVALRIFNTYGSHQSLSNPYAGVLPIFASRLLNNRPPLLYEDGGQLRDFVHVQDVARACRLAIETPGVAGETINIGSGDACTVRNLAEQMAAVLHKEEILPQVTGKYRAGDIRHCFADITKARKLLDYEPRVTLKEGLAELVGWLHGQHVVDQMDLAHAQLAQRGLTV